MSQNGNFIEFVKIVNNNPIDDEMYNKACELYKQLEYLDNAEIIHIYGILQYKRGNINEAKEYMKDAVLKLYKDFKEEKLFVKSINIEQFHRKNITRQLNGQKTVGFCSCVAYFLPTIICLLTRR